MKTFLLIIAYLCIWSTPIQIGICFWALFIVFNTEATILSLTNDLFLSQFLPWLYAWVKPLTYYIFPHIFANFLWSLPVFIHQLLKAFFSTWLGFWLLLFIKKKYKNNTELT